MNFWAFVLLAAAIAIAASWILDKLLGQMRPCTDWERFLFMGAPERCSWCGAKLKINIGSGWVTLFCPTSREHEYFRFREDEVLACES